MPKYPKFIQNLHLSCCCRHMGGGAVFFPVAPTPGPGADADQPQRLAVSVQLDNAPEQVHGPLGITERPSQWCRGCNLASWTLLHTSHGRQIDPIINTRQLKLCSACMQEELEPEAAALLQKLDAEWEAKEGSTTGVLATAAAPSRGAAAGGRGRGRDTNGPFVGPTTAAAAGRRPAAGRGGQGLSGTNPVASPLVSPLRRAAALQASQQAAGGAHSPVGAATADAADGVGGSGGIAAERAAAAPRPVLASPRPRKRRALMQQSQEGF